MARTFLPWGPNGSGKSTFGIADASEEEPISYHQFEPSGFRRAAIRLGLNENNLPSWIRLHKYHVPVQEMESMGVVQVTRNGNVLPQVRYELKGWTEVIAQYNQNYMDDCKAGYRPITDTTTRLWLAQQQAWEQQVQEATNGGDSAKLDRLKFTTPNARMSGAMEFAGAYELDAIFIAHEGSVYNSDPPIAKPDAWKESENLADVSLRFRVSDRTPIATIVKGAESGMALKGLDVPEPTLKKLNCILDAAAALAVEHEEIPRDAEQLLNMGRLMGLMA